MYQPALFNTGDIFDKPLKKYELFFSVLDLSLLEKSTGVGRKPVSRAAILRALIFKNLRSIASLSDLSAELYERPRLTSILGFKPGDKPVPVERFSSYLKSTNNALLQKVRASLVKKLIEQKIVKGKPPKNDPDCRIGAFPNFISGKTKVEFYWGYRNHIVNDAIS